MFKRLNARVGAFALILLLINVHVNGQCGLDCDSNDGHDHIEDLIEAMTDIGYDVSTGNFELYDPETISSLYIPFTRSDTDYLIAQFEDGITYTRFGGRDAIVFRFCTPPAEVTYFGYRSYLATQITNQTDVNTPTKYTLLDASLGDTTNQKSIQTESSDTSSFDPPFDRKTNIVTTGDMQTWTDIMNSFVLIDLLDEMSLNLDAINDGTFIYSESELDTPRDLLTIILRIQFDDNSECNKDQYLNQSFPFYWFSMTSTEPRSPINQPLRDTIDPNQECENSVKNINDFDEIVSNTIEYIETEFNYTLVSNNPLNDAITDNLNIFVHGFECISNQVNCFFDNRDTYYSWDTIQHTLNDNDYYLIIGLNHNNFNLSITNSISLSSVENRYNYDTITNEEYEQFDFEHIINSHNAMTDNIFIVQVARLHNCMNSNIPSICPNFDIVEENERFIFFGEATLNYQTQTMPDQNCLIAWKLLSFSTIPITTIEPTEMPTEMPTQIPTINPTINPSPSSTTEPPIPAPTPIPTEIPSPEPSDIYCNDIWKINCLGYSAQCTFYNSGCIRKQFVKFKLNSLIEYDTNNCITKNKVNSFTLHPYELDGEYNSNSNTYKSILSVGQWLNKQDVEFVLKTTLYNGTNIAEWSVFIKQWPWLGNNHRLKLSINIMTNGDLSVNDFAFDTPIWALYDNIVKQDVIVYDNEQNQNHRDFCFSFTDFNDSLVYNQSIKYVNVMSDTNSFVPTTEAHHIDFVQFIMILFYVAVAVNVVFFAKYCYKKSKKKYQIIENITEEMEKVQLCELDASDDVSNDERESLF